MVIFLCLVGFGAGGVLGAIGADSWTKDIIDRIPSNVQFLFDVIVQTRDALAATAVS